ncbi:putative membrane protein [Besnoitia besnoiti]|uniref:Putative membrane protein n=1 Tax=Besnoitia besnoiti TaxID=94643 RepID=A0A2A9MPC3_BESBE|nr:putative membrane protein [Besnoitia besnoiti]PFH37660.1 putative membrane protein [Besnoitia besnoiti]
MHVQYRVGRNAREYKRFSAMFLIVVTNNFGEIKSTVFKRFSSTTIFSIVGADVVERFQLCCDAFIVSLKLATAASPRATSLAAV